MIDKEPIFVLASFHSSKALGLFIPWTFQIIDRRSTQQPTLDSSVYKAAINKFFSRNSVAFVSFFKSTLVNTWPLSWLSLKASKQSIDFPLVSTDQD